MGLDITAYEHVMLVAGEHVKEDEAGNCCYESARWGGQDHIPIYNEPSFPHSLGSIQNGKCYVATGEEFRFHGGSYSGYNAWREALCEVALGVAPRYVWRDPESWLDQPFCELINFSDCQGAFGPEVSAKLARDFREHRHDVMAKLAAQADYWGEKYDDFQRAFKLASGDGLVYFH